MGSTHPLRDLKQRIDFVQALGVQSYQPMAHCLIHHLPQSPPSMPPWTIVLERRPQRIPLSQRMLSRT